MKITHGQAALLLSSVLGLTGCASAYGPTRATTESDTVAVADSDVVCTRDVATGTRFLRTVCMSKADRAAVTEAAQRAADAIRATPPDVKQ